MNLHPSWLPKLRDPTSIQAVLLDGDTETGITYHYATPDVDAETFSFRRGTKYPHGDERFAEAATSAAGSSAAASRLD